MPHLYGPVSGYRFVAWLETEGGLAAIDSGRDVASGKPYEGSEVEAMVEACHASGKPLSHVLLTHDHADHVLNLPLLLERWPDAQVYAHPSSAVEGVTERLRGGESLDIGGETIQTLYTPGHSTARDELCYYLPEHRFLFCGAVAQPQGPSYGYATGPSPVPFFHDGGAYRHSLETLIALDAHYGRTGHGDFLGPEQVRQWLRITLATVARIEELALQ
ncbi:MAG: MBL fold metallo-hydrolase, partial [Ardenticatenaceae bacterium]